MREGQVLREFGLTEINTNGPHTNPLNGRTGTNLQHTDTEKGRLETETREKSHSTPCPMIDLRGTAGFRREDTRERSRKDLRDTRERKRSDRNTPDTSTASETSDPKEIGDQLESEVRSECSDVMVTDIKEEDLTLDD